MALFGPAQPARSSASTNFLSSPSNESKVKNYAQRSVTGSALALSLLGLAGCGSSPSATTAGLGKILNMVVAVLSGYAFSRLIVINDVNDLGTVPLGLQFFFSAQGSQWHLVMAAAVISMALTLLLLILLQKHLVKGIATSGLGRR